jgi:hypothetical protein
MQSWMRKKLPTDLKELRELTGGLYDYFLDLAEEVDQLGAQFEKCEMMKRRLARKIDAVAMRLAAWTDEIDVKSGSRVLVCGTNVRPPWGQVDHYCRNELARKAEEGIRFLKIGPREKDATTVKMDSVEFTLDGLPLDLLEILAAKCQANSGQHDSEDGWISKQAIAVELELRHKRSFRQHTVDNIISRLRSDLWEQSINPFLVKTRDKEDLVRLLIHKDGNEFALA